MSDVAQEEIIDSYSKVEHPQYLTRGEDARKKIAFIFAKGWKTYYSCSPFYWFLFTDHPDIDVIEFDASLGAGKAIDQIAASQYIGIVMCEASASSFDIENIPCLVVTDDLHRYVKNYNRKYYNFYNRYSILADYGLTENIDELPLSMSQKVRGQTIYLPNYVADAPCHRPHAERKPVGIAGTLNEGGYPMRTRLVETLADLNPFPERRALREAFIDVLGEYRVGFTDDVRFGSMVAKYFEIPMAGSLLIAPEPHSEIERLMMGFDADNAILMPRDRLYDDAFVEKTVRDAVAEADWTEARAWAGQALVRRRHTVEARVRYLWLVLNRMNEGVWSLRDQFDLFLAAERAPDSRLDGGDTLADTPVSGRLLVDVRTGYRHDAIAGAIGPETTQATLVVSSATVGRRLVSQLAAEKPAVALAWKLTDRTRVERLTARHDHVKIADADGLHDQPPIAERMNWLFTTTDGDERQRSLNFWREIGILLAKRFGKSMVRVTEDENFDWAHGGIDFWLWKSRTHLARVRAEGVIGHGALIGILRPDGGSIELEASVLARLKAGLGNSSSNDHWQAYASIPHYLAARDEDVGARERLQKTLADVMGDVLRMILDETTDDHNPHAPM